MIRRWSRWLRDAIVRDWRTYDDPSYYFVSGAVFLVPAGIFLFDARRPVLGLVFLLFAAFCFWCAIRTLRHRRR